MKPNHHIIMNTYNVPSVANVVTTNKDQSKIFQLRNDAAVV